MNEKRAKIFSQWIRSIEEINRLSSVILYWSPNINRNIAICLCDLRIVSLAYLSASLFFSIGWTINWQRNLLSCAFLKWWTNCVWIGYLFLSNCLFIQQLIVAEWVGWTVNGRCRTVSRRRPLSAEYWMSQRTLGRYSWTNSFTNFRRGFLSLFSLVPILLLANTTIEDQVEYTWFFDLEAANISKNKTNWQIYFGQDHICCTRSATFLSQDPLRIGQKGKEVFLFTVIRYGNWL